MELRPYQREAVDAVYRHLRERDDNPVVVIPTAGGKTPVIATVCRDAATMWGEAACDHDPGKGFQNLVRPVWYRPFFTLARLNPGNGRGTPLHPEQDRTLSIPEAKRIGSFPDAFQMAGQFAQRWACIGNSVPPLFMLAIAAHVRDRVLATAEKEVA